MIAILLLRAVGSSPAEIMVIALVEVLFGLVIGYFMLGRFAGLRSRLGELTLRYRLLLRNGFFIGSGDKAVSGDLAMIDYYMKRYYSWVKYKVEVHGYDAVLYASLDLDSGIRLINSLNSELSVLNINEYRTFS
ncbi:hypothetical protein GCM10007981_18240 [Thermocladium modestius]|uniref:Uncharacterized protein n=1 Tax=Thermocladium modestius TaxID=62609 RepID=A0A830GXC2_9CREN|nr:hypothetical protein GCM10007981_18240 [Thermocladium modestius]